MVVVIVHMADALRVGKTLCGKNMDNLEVDYIGDKVDCKKCLYTMDDNQKSHMVGVLLTSDDEQLVEKYRGDLTRSKFCRLAIREKLKLCEYEERAKR